MKSNPIQAEAKEYAEKIMLGGCLNENDNPAYSIERNAIMAHYIAGASRTINPESGIETTSYLMGVEDGKEIAKKQLSELSNTSTIEREGLREKYGEFCYENYGRKLIDRQGLIDAIWNFFAPHLKDSELQKENEKLLEQRNDLVNSEIPKHLAEISRLRNIVRTFEIVTEGDKTAVVRENEMMLSECRNLEKQKAELQKTIDLLIKSHDKLTSRLNTEGQTNRDAYQNNLTRDYSRKKNLEDKERRDDKYKDITE